jgi:hypothetical protein
VEPQDQATIEHLLEQAHLAIVRQNFSEAQNLIDQIIECDPGNADAIQLLADLQPQPLPQSIENSIDDERIRMEQEEYRMRDRIYNNAEYVNSTRSWLFWDVICNAYNAVVNFFIWR